MNSDRPPHDSDPARSSPVGKENTQQDESSKDSGPTETMHHPIPSPARPKRIGQYRIKREIASGGMGTVFEAVQENPRRTVAVKVMRQGIASRSALRRFEFEAQLLARLRHPGIAQIYEAGTHRDDSGTTPYFAMEYIPSAKSITKFAKDKRLGRRERMALFMDVCDAVHHGHQKGIIHRDLKPSNILVDSSGQVKVIDFGVARSTDSDMAVTTLQTSVGQLIGTLQYMSPEQCEADPHDIDTRSDVYALGMVFFELLSDHLPYELKDKTIAAATRVIRESRPTKLSVWNRALHGDVETIAAKALEKDRERRYQSASDLKQDIERCLNNEPIVARRASLTYQMAMIVRRNKAVFAAFALAFLTLVVATVVSFSLYVQASHSAQRAASEAVRSEQVASLLESMLEGVGPSVALGRDTTMLREILAQTAARIDKDLEGQPGVEASLRTTIGSAYLALGQYELADKHLRRAEALAADVFGEANPRTLHTKSLLADLLFLQGRWTEAEKRATETLRVRREVLGDSHPDTLTSANRLAEVLRKQGRFADAERMYSDTLRQRRSTLGTEHPDTLTSMANLATVYYDQRKFKEAEQLNRLALAARRQVLGQEHPDTLSSMHNLAIALWSQGEPEQAAVLYRNALEIKKRVMGDEHPSTLKTMNNLGSILLGQNKNAEAEAVFRETLEIKRHMLGADHPSTLVTLRGLADSLHKQGKLDEWRIHKRERLVHLKHRAEMRDGGPAAMNEYAWVLLTYEPLDMRDPKTALVVAKRAVNLSQASNPMFLDTLARAYHMTDHLDDAIETQRRALAQLEPGNFPIREALEESLLKYLEQKQNDAAVEEVLRAAVSRYRGAFPKENALLATSLARLGRFLLDKKRYAEAEPIFRSCMEIQKTDADKDDWRMSDTMSVLGEALMGRQAYDEAEPLLIAAYDGLGTISGTPPDRLQQAHDRLKRLYQAMGRPDKIPPAPSGSGMGRPDKIPAAPSMSGSGS
ncbi:MAG: tetratricopeptide repeat protein [Planctomycetes bacterium]|nr:tetratricopeptide repeat protein [Planctomycetota bacterium]